MGIREERHIRINTRSALWKKQKGVCAYCGKSISVDKASLDHVIPIDRGGQECNHPNNLVVTCIRCNKNKSNHIIFSLLEDHKVYPMIEVPYFFRVYDIQRNRMKGEVEYHE